MSKINVFHRYKWTLEEKITLSIPTVFLIALTLYFFITEGRVSGLVWTVDAVWVGSFWLLAYIGNAKKKSSKLEAIYDEDTTFVSVEGNKIYKHGTNKGHLNKFDKALIKQVGQNPTLVLSSKDQEIRNLNIPLRVASKQPFLTFLEKNVRDNENITKVKVEEFKDFFEKAKTYKR